MSYELVVELKEIFTLTLIYKRTHEGITRNVMWPLKSSIILINY